MASAVGPASAKAPAGDRGPLAFCLGLTFWDGLLLFAFVCFLFRQMGAYTNVEHTAAGRKFVVLLHVALEHLATPFPLRFLHPVLRFQHYSNIISFPRIISSASQAT